MEQVGYPKFAEEYRCGRKLGKHRPNSTRRAQERTLETLLTHPTLVIGYDHGLDTHFLESDDCMAVMRSVSDDAVPIIEKRWDLRHSLT